MRYNGKEVEFIKDYGNWILIKYPEGFKEGVNKQDLGLIREREYKKTTPILRGIYGGRV